MLRFRLWCRGAESNCRRKDFQSFALPLSYPGKGTVLGLLSTRRVKFNRKPQRFQTIFSGIKLFFNLGIDMVIFLVYYDVNIEKQKQKLAAKI